GRSEGVGRLVEPRRRDADESERAAAEEPAGPSRAQLEAAAAAARAEEVAAAGAERVARDRLAALERVLEEREGLPPAARALAERGERLVLSELEVEPGDERAITAALGARASALVASDSQAALRLLDRAREEGLGGLTVVLERALREDVRIGGGSAIPGSCAPWPRLPSGRTRSSRPLPGSRRGSRRRFARGSTRVPCARGRSAPSSVGSEPPRPSCGARPPRPASARRRSRSSWPSSRARLRRCGSARGRSRRATKRIATASPGGS